MSSREDVGRVPTAPGSSSLRSPESLRVSARSGNDPSRELWHQITAAIGPILKDAFPHEHGITRLQVAQAIATRLECLGNPSPGVSEDLRRQMHADGLSLRDAAPKIGVSFSTLGRLLRGGVPIPRNRKKVELWLAKRIRAALSDSQLKTGKDGGEA